MYTFAAGVTETVVAVDQQHQECQCVGIVIATHEGKIHLFAESPEAFEALGWGILAAAEAIRKSAPATVSVPDG